MFTEKGREIGELLLGSVPLNMFTQPNGVGARKPREAVKYAVAMHAHKPVESLQEGMLRVSEGCSAVHCSMLVTDPSITTMHHHLID